MRLPFKGLYIFTQDFGANPQNYKQFLVLQPDGSRAPLKGHDGLDFGCPTRTEVVAPHDGEIIEVSSDPPGYGIYVKIENDEEGSVIAHLDAAEVKVGWKLQEGDHIGWSDNTGNSTGPHVHWGWYPKPRDRSNGYGGFFDQKPHLALAGIKLTVGQLPVINAVKATTQVAEDSGTMYKGIDKTNDASVNAAIDGWYDLAHGKYKTVEEYNALNTQYETVKEQLSETLKADSDNSPSLNAYRAMVALGYTNVDDIKNALQRKDDTVSQLQRDQVVLEKKNETLALTLAEDSKNNYTGMETGLSAADKLKEYEEGIQSLGAAAGITEKPTINKIATKIFGFKDLAEKWMKKLENDYNARKGNNTTNSNVAPAGKSSLDWLVNLFSSILPEKEVK